MIDGQTDAVDPVLSVLLPAFPLFAFFRPGPEGAPAAGAVPVQGEALRVPGRRGAQPRNGNPDIAAAQFQLFHGAADLEADVRLRFRNPPRHVVGLDFGPGRGPGAAVEGQFEGGIAARVVLEPNHAGLHVFDGPGLRQPEALGELHLVGDLARVLLLDDEPVRELLVVVLVDLRGPLAHSGGGPVDGRCAAVARRDAYGVHMLDDVQAFRADDRPRLGQQQVAARLGGDRRREEEGRGQGSEATGSESPTRHGAVSPLVVCERAPLRQGITRKRRARRPAYGSGRRGRRRKVGLRPAIRSRLRRRRVRRPAHPAEDKVGLRPAIRSRLRRQRVGRPAHPAEAEMAGRKSRYHGRSAGCAGLPTRSGNRRGAARPGSIRRRPKDGDDSSDAAYALTGSRETPSGPARARGFRQTGCGTPSSGFDRR